MARALTAAAGWLTRPVPRGRIAAFRTLIYLFVAADLLLFTPWVRDPARLSGELYQPLFVGRLLPLPTPTPLLLSVVFWTLLGLSLLAATGRAPRALGWAVFVLYFEWMIIAMSYGKVDHDRFAFLVALAVLPTAGRARHGDPVRTEAGGWALRVTQIAVVCTYFLAAWAKLRFGGIEWLTGSVLARAIIRRGTELADLIAQVPYLLIAAQLGIVAFELLSPIVFALSGRWRRAAIGFFYSFHLVTFATITISFAPHLVAMTAFLRLERIRPIHWLRRRIRPAGRPQPVPAQAVAEPSPPPHEPSRPTSGPSPPTSEPGRPVEPEVQPSRPGEPSQPVGAEAQSAAGPATGGLGTAQAAVPPGIR